MGSDKRAHNQITRHTSPDPGGLPTAWLCEIRGRTTHPVMPLVAGAGVTLMS